MGKVRQGGHQRPNLPAWLIDLSEQETESGQVAKKFIHLEILTDNQRKGILTILGIKREEHFIEKIDHVAAVCELVRDSRQSVEQAVKAYARSKGIGKKGKRKAS